MKTTIVLLSLVSVALSLSLIPCPECDPEAGCQPAKCPCFVDGKEYIAPRNPPQLVLPNCPACPERQPSDCLSSRVSLRCSPPAECTADQLATYTYVHNYGGQ